MRHPRRERPAPPPGAPVPKDKTRAGREIPKDERKIVNKLVEQGWTYVPPHKGHGKLIPADPEAPMLTVSSTPSDRMGITLWLTKIRRSGGVI